MTGTMYRVLRPFDDLPPGTVLPEAAFVSEERIHTLISLGWITPTLEGMQPTVRTIVSTPLPQLPTILAMVEDRCLVLEAKAKDKRKGAKAIYEEFLEAMP